MSGKAFWRFSVLNAGIPERVPREAEFFHFSNPTEVVVREAVQNSLDAMREDQKQVTVRFTMGKVRKEDIGVYLDGLESHLSTTKVLESDFQEFQKRSKIRFLTIEDFGTTGLDGETRRETRTSEKSNFYDFWWREGISSKTRKEAGRWGVGKISFFNVSQLRTLWGITVRADDKRELMLGKTILTPHEIEKVLYDYYGYFKGGEGDEPVQDPDVIQKFKDNFHIQRSSSEFGFSLVILMPIDEINYEGIIQSAIMHYFFAILNGSIKVEITDVKKQCSLTIDANNIQDIARRVEWRETPWRDRDAVGILQFAAESMRAGQIINLNVARSFEVTESSFGEKLDEIRTSFMQGDMLHFRIPLTIKKRESISGSVWITEPSTYFDIFVKRCLGLENPDEFYIRSNILIPDIKSIRRHSVRAMLVAQDETISEFLGDSEPPAHTNWNAFTGGFLKKYLGGKNTLLFVRKSVGKIVSLLDQLPRESLQNFLIDIFFIPKPTPSEEEVITPPPPPPPPPPRKKSFDIGKVTGGFRIFLEKDTQPPITAEVEVAYDTWRGNAFKRYTPFDFDLADKSINKTTQGGIINRCGRNRIEFTALGADFRLEVTGFDPKRDLVINVPEKRE